ncbi:DUF1501 domain-containing protein [Vibrio astriarenae]|uniref:DUF1501 domain-containing protein n=1 Tax=Vibrio astriarenae TaxID=1481923 RepID=A0A7Z2T5Z8_9VIBR|nr:DUF1501 domain-containing protein [Vibrio astriarenae]QIA64941.1 DUF1501 domain-containing protein [Vibrio astriarenae]
MKLSRRTFMQSGAASFGVGALSLSPFSAVADWHQCGQSFKAVVGIDLAGGNDGFNMFVPASGDSATQYKTIRQSLALDSANSIALEGSNLAMHSSMSALKKWWQNSSMLPILNQGPLIKPLTNQTIDTSNSPTHLYSHSHQSTMVQSHTASTWVSKQGFGALTAKILEKMPLSMQDMPPLFDIAGTQVWTNALEAQATSVGVKPPSNIFSEDEGFDVTLFNNLHDKSQQSNVFKQHYAHLATESRGLYHEFSSIFDTDTGDDFPQTKLGQQLATVFKLIINKDKFDHPIQYFSCKLGGFDTHSNQLNAQTALLEELAEALDAFHTALERHGLHDNVVSFTHSEFGRTLTPNATQGTDHGWGSHSLVMGGAIDGARILGDYPDLSENSEYLLSRGRIIPTIASDQIHATILSWLGLRPSGIDLLFPALKRSSSEFPSQTLPLFKPC